MTTESSEKRSQLDKFKDAARKLECDDDEQRFKRRIREVARPKAKNTPGKKP